MPPLNFLAQDDFNFLINFKIKSKNNVKLKHSKFQIILCFFIINNNNFFTSFFLKQSLIA